jgi:haloacetate dehalogenase
VYVRQLGEKESVHGMCEDYRAGATVDLDEQRRDIEDGRNIKCSVRVLWGRKGVVGKLFDALKEWREVSDGSVEGEALDCGHYIPEEKPDEVIRHVRKFFV